MAWVQFRLEVTEAANVALRKPSVEEQKRIFVVGALRSCTESLREIQVAQLKMNSANVDGRLL